jgi:hypothetical protein
MPFSLRKPPRLVEVRKAPKRGRADLGDVYALHARGQTRRGADLLLEYTAPSSLNSARPLQEVTWTNVADELAGDLQQTVERK